MKYLLYLPIILLGSLSLNAQRVTVSDELSIRSERAYGIIGKVKDKFLFYREQPSKVRINAFNDKLRKSWEKELEFDRKRVDIIGITSNEENFTVIYSFLQKGEMTIKAHTYDDRANLQDSTTLATYNKVFGEPKYKMILSEDNTKALLYYTKEKKTFRGLAYDLKTSKALWFHQFNFEYSKFYNEYSEILVSNDGEAYLIVSHDNRKNKIEDHRYFVYRYGEGLKTAQLMKVPMDAKMSTDVKFGVDNKNKKIVAGGLFSIKNSARAEGYFSLIMDVHNMKDYGLVFKKFDDIMIKDIVKDKVRKGNTLEDLEIRDVILRQDGGMILAFEFTKEYSRRMAGNRGIVGMDGNRYTVDYYLDDLILLAVHPDGKQHWQEILRKKQHSQDDNAVYSSYFLFKTPSALRLVFNDAINFENTVSEYLINPVGKYERNSVLSTEGQDLKLRFRDAVQIASNEMIIPSETKGEVKLVRVTF